MYIDVNTMKVRLWYDGKWIDVESAQKACDYMEDVKRRANEDQDPPDNRFARVAEEACGES